MFKKLKKKIEEGEEVGSGLDKLAFSPSKLPGGAVRSSPTVDSETRPFPGDGAGQAETATPTSARAEKDRSPRDPGGSGDANDRLTQEEDLGAGPQVGGINAVSRAMSL